jgi:hypothetical protein
MKVAVAADGVRIGWTKRVAAAGAGSLLSEVATVACRLSIRVGVGVADPGDSVVQLVA